MYFSKVLGILYNYVKSDVWVSLYWGMLYICGVRLSHDLIING